MQTYALNLTNGAARSFSTSGDLFVYESGQVAGQENADARIIVKPDSGGEITLRAGQQFRLPKGETASQWFVRPAVEGAQIVGAIIIGAGEFHDANTLNTFKLDGTFVNTVTVNNSADSPVPVAIKEGGSIVAFTHSAADSNTAASYVKTVVEPSANVNGIVVEAGGLCVSSYNATGVQGASIIAKAGVPANHNDGAVLLRAALYMAANIASISQVQAQFERSVKLPPGVGLYFMNTPTASGAAEKYVLYTVL